MKAIHAGVRFAGRDLKKRENELQRANHALH
jgi:hypothetical protein